jgi:uncharacterized protein
MVGPKLRAWMGAVLTPFEVGNTALADPDKTRFLMRPLINLHDAQAHHGGAGVPSPCVSICELDVARSRCKGCYRSLQEIAAWGGLSDADKRAVWEQIEERQRHPGAWSNP